MEESAVIHRGLSVEEGDNLWEVTHSKIEAAAGDKSASNNITVITRVRPFNQREKDLNTVNCVEMKTDDVANQQCWITDPSKKDAGPSQFRFDYCFDTHTPGAKNYVNQQMVFEAVGLDILAKAWSGYNACLFAYGQTGSGKTYSIMGYDQDKGVIPRICDALFYFIAKLGGSSSFKVDASYLEIYNEQIGDLLAPAPNIDKFVPLKPKERIKCEEELKKLLKTKGWDPVHVDKLRAKLDPEEWKKQIDAKLPKVKEDPEKGVVVDNLKHFAVSSFAECEKLLDEGLTNRTVGSTAMNATSSRSHCVFTLELTQVEGARTSKITLIDLAGSEKTQTAKTEGQSLLEGININKSLSCLGQCIAGLAKAAASKDAEEAKKTPEQRAREAEEARKAEEEKKAKAEAAKAKAKKKAAAPAAKYGTKTGPAVKRIEQMDDFVPFRESVLTWILRDSLVGNSKTVMLAALSPAASNYQETLSTLRFAAQAKQLKTKAIVNEDPVQRLIADLKAEILLLKKQLTEGGSATVDPRDAADAVNADAIAATFEEVDAAHALAHPPRPNKLSKRNSAKEAAMEDLAAKEAEMFKLVEEQLAAREAEWQEKEANMKQLLMDAAENQDNGSGNKMNRKVTSMIHGTSKSDDAPYLTFLTKDPASDRTVRISPDASGGKVLRVGQPGAATPQDLELDGVGISPETCLLWAVQPTAEAPALFRVQAASPGSVVFVNGQKLTQPEVESDPSGLEAAGAISRQDGSLPLQHGDRLALGHCAHVLTVVDPKKVAAAAAAAEGGEEGSQKEGGGKSTNMQEKLATFDTCVHEVMLMRSFGSAQYEARLAAFVVSKLRLPATRAAFEEQLLLAVHAAREANAMATELGCHVAFRVRGGGEVDVQRLYSLRLEDALPHHAVHLSVQAVVLPPTSLPPPPHAFGPGDQVTWKSADDDLPAGTIGEVTAVHEDGDVECLFPTSDGPALFTFTSLRLNLVQAKEIEEANKAGEVEGKGDGDQNAVQEAMAHQGRILFECSVDEFSDCVECMKTSYQKLKRVVNSLGPALLAVALDVTGALIASMSAGTAAAALAAFGAQVGGNSEASATKAALKWAGKRVEGTELVDRAFESTAVDYGGGSLAIDSRADFGAALAALGLTDHDLTVPGTRRRRTGADAVFTLAWLHAALGLKASGDETRIDRAAFKLAVAVFMRKQVLNALQGPWLPLEPDAATARCFCGAALHQADVDNGLGVPHASYGGGPGGVTATELQLLSRMSAAVKAQDFALATSLQADLEMAQDAAANARVSNEAIQKDGTSRSPRTSFEASTPSSSGARGFKKSSKILNWSGSKTEHEEPLSGASGSNSNSGGGGGVGRRLIAGLFGSPKSPGEEDGGGGGFAEDGSVLGVESSNSGSTASARPKPAGPKPRAKQHPKPKGRRARGAGDGAASAANGGGGGGVMFPMSPEDSEAATANPLVGGGSGDHSDDDDDNDHSRSALTPRGRQAEVSNGADHVGPSVEATSPILPTTVASPAREEALTPLQQRLNSASGGGKTTAPENGSDTTGKALTPLQQRLQSVGSNGGDHDALKGTPVAEPALTPLQQRLQSAGSGGGESKAKEVSAELPQKSTIKETDEQLPAPVESALPPEPTHVATAPSVSTPKSATSLKAPAAPPPPPPPPPPPVPEPTPETTPAACSTGEGADSSGGQINNAMSAGRANDDEEENFAGRGFGSKGKSTGLSFAFGMGDDDGEEEDLLRDLSSVRP